MNNYKICIYAICKNESTNVKEGMESMFEADYICVLDTGSTDDTYDQCLKGQTLYPNKIFVKQQTFIPGRFDIARNESMKLIPKDTDICMCTDLDERLISGGAKDLRSAGTPNLTRVLYKYAGSHNIDGTPGRVFGYDKIHSYGEGVGKFPVHETLTYIGTRPEQETKLSSEKIYLHHYPSPKESRGNYLPLLELRAQENQDDFYGLVYLAHEYYYQNKYDKCINFINNVVGDKIPLNDDYLCRTDLCLFLGKSYCQLNNFSAAEECFRRGIELSEEYRENYLELANLFLSQGKYQETIDLINIMLKKTKRFYSGLEGDISGTYQPYDILSLAYYYSGNKLVALDYAILAASLDQNNIRLQNNITVIRNNL